MGKELYFLSKEFWTTPWLVALFILTMFLIVLLRYLIFSAAYLKLLPRFSSRKINSHNNDIAQWKTEIKWSALSSLVFALLTAASLWAYQHGLTRVYDNFSEYSIGYFVFTICMMLISYETYYYWLHRWMHRPSIYRIVHKVHHKSIHTSVFTSFSFHPLEAFLQFIFLPVFIAVIPVHYSALGIVLMFMTISAIINHSGAEIFPVNFQRHRLWKWLIGATHHDLHHKEFKSNFGLYLTCWDKWMGTESKNYETAFKKNARG